MRGPVVCFGDSLTEGWGVEPEESYPAHLERLVGVPVLNAGWRGDRAVDALDRLESQVLPADPRLVVVAFGSNEAAHGEPIEVARRGLDEILSRLARRRVPSVLVGVRHADYRENFEDVLRSLASQFGTGLVLDALHGILEDPSLRSDPDHPNTEGYRILAERVAPAIRRALKPAAP